MIDMKALSDDEVTELLGRCAGRERGALADVLRALIEFDKRDLARKKAYPNLYAYCTKALGYSEDEACKRINVARIAANYQSVLRYIETGRLSLSVVNLLSPRLNSQSYRSLFERCAGKTLREAEFILAEMFPRPEPREVVRHLGGGSAPEPSLPMDSASSLPSGPGTIPSGSRPTGAQEAEEHPSRAQEQSADGRLAQAGPAGPPSKVVPISRERVRYAFTVGMDVHDDVRKCRELLRHKYPKGDVESIFKEAIESLLDAIDPDRQQQRRRRSSNPASRRIPLWVQEEVWRRDGGCCVYTAPDGRRCASRDFIQFDHVLPWSIGGSSNDPRNIRLLCGPHNRREAIERLGTQPPRASAGPAAGRGLGPASPPPPA